jgi:hypothetical protein
MCCGITVKRKGMLVSVRKMKALTVKMERERERERERETVQ